MNKLCSSLFNWTTVAALLLTAQLTNLAADSLWKGENARPMFADKKAKAVGDIITVLVEENNGSTRANTTTTAKTVGVDANITSFLYGPTASGLLTQGGQYPALKFNSANDFTGGGSINNAETITAKISVRVIDVLPNGNMVVEGKRKTEFSGEKQDAILRGVVRYDDIMANNTVYSYNLSDSTIQFIGKGTITDNQKKGWFSKIWEKFSPF